MLAGVLLTLFLALSVSQAFKELEARQSIVIYCAKVTRSLLLLEHTYVLTTKHSIFFVRAGLIVDMLFILFFVYNAVYWAENE